MSGADDRDGDGAAAACVPGQYLPRLLSLSTVAALGLLGRSVPPEGSAAAL